MVASAQCVQSVTRALQLRGRTIVRVHGRSMYPALRNGVRLEVQPVVYDELRIGDLVVYHNGSGMICHRLIRKSGPPPLCQGRHKSICRSAGRLASGAGPRDTGYR